MNISFLVLIKQNEENIIYNLIKPIFMLLENFNAKVKIIFMLRMKKN